MNIPFIAALVGALIAFASGAEAQTPITLFGTKTPVTPVDPDTNSVTLGVQFYSSQSGTVAGVRFFRGARSSSGYSVGIFDASSGARLAVKSITSEPCASMPCWEEIDFSAPLPIAANKTYVAAYFVKGGHYAGDNLGLSNAVMSGSLAAPANAQAVGGNGLYYYGTSLLRPTNTYQATNYWVDISFTSNAPPPPTLVMSFSPPSPSVDPAATIGTQVATVNVDWSDDVNGSHPFTGTIGFAQPYSNDSGTFSLSGNNLVTSASVRGDAGTLQNVTIQAVQ